MAKQLSLYLINSVAQLWILFLMLHLEWFEISLILVYDCILKSKPYTRQVIKKLRQMGYDQIMERIKLLKADSYVPSDLLGITLKEIGKFLMIFA